MRIGFVLSQTFKGIKSNRIMVASLALVTFVSLMFLGAAGLLQTQVQNMKDEWYERVEISVFMCPINSTKAQCASGEATQEQIDDVHDFLLSDDMKDYVQEVYVESKEDALANFQKQMKDSTWVEALRPEDMQVSLRVKLVNPEEYKILSDEVGGRPGVESVIDQRQQLQPIFNVLNGATVISAVLAITMIVTALLLIITMVRLSAMFRSRDTAIMRVVGASNALIQIPFILEGVFAALIGSLLASATLFGGVKYLFERADTEQRFIFINLIDSGDVLMFVPWLILGALLLTAGASFIALRRYTKV